MGSCIDQSLIQSTEEIPIIDLSAAAADDLVAVLGGACEEWGFFQVINHGVAPEKREKLEREARRFFALPAEEKRKVRRSAAKPLGYYDSEHTKNIKDWKEVFDFNAVDPILAPASPDPDDGQVLELRSQWPNFAPELREACQGYADEMIKLSYKLLELIATSLGLSPTRFHGFFKHQISFLRLNYYPTCPFPDKVLGVGPHKDGSALTILAIDDVPGLEIKRKSDGQWVPVKPTPNALIVNVGDVLQVWSNDKYDSIEHRVKANLEKDRLSIPFFFGPSHYVDVKPLDELINEHNPPRYKEYNYGKFYSTRRFGDFKKLDVENIQIHHFKFNT